jgi:Na+/serine symporter
MDTIGVLIVLAIFTAIYLLPTIVASTRGHQSAVAIFFLNLLLGWTLIGWVVAVVWSFTNPTQVVVNNQTAKSAADEIQKLAALKEQGILTEDEFTRKKLQILENA